MRLPEFFDSVPRITLRDPLARFLGAAEDGVIEYGHAAAVKLGYGRVASSHCSNVRAIRMPSSFVTDVTRAWRSALPRVFRAQST